MYTSKRERKFGKPSHATELEKMLADTDYLFDFLSDDPQYNTLAAKNTRASQANNRGRFVGGVTINAQ